MPTKLNTEFNYRYQVIGETPWEKIKTLKGFLAGRKRAAALEKVSALKHKARVSELEHAINTGALPHVILNLQADLFEAESFLEEEKEAYELNRQEIGILERLLAELYEIVEPTRVPGYTDEEMFELNAVNEFTIWVARELHSEMCAVGHFSPAKIRNAMSNPITWKALQDAGMVPKDAMLLESNTDPSCIQVPLLQIENIS